MDVCLEKTRVCEIRCPEAENPHMTAAQALGTALSASQTMTSVPHITQ
jgi:hypothetical protein